MTSAIVVIGGGQAAASLIAKLRQLEFDGSITLVCEEPVLPYQRPPLSKKYLLGDMGVDNLIFYPDDWYAQNKVTVLKGVAAEAIDRQAKSVRLSDGTELSYDKLALTTGSAPRRLPASVGGDLEGVYVVRDLADVDSMAEEFAEGRRVLVVGGGYIGLEAAAVAAMKGLNVTVVEMADRILQRVAAAATSDFFRDLHAGRGVNILESTGLKTLIGTDGRVSGAELADGSTLDVDFVVVGIGITPRDQLAVEAGITVDNGIAVDESCRTSDPDIFAAGDCASFPYRGHRIRLESVQNAIDQAQAVAVAMTGQDVNYIPKPWFWSDQFDVKLQIGGLNTGYDDTVVRPGARPGAQSVWYFAGDQLLAVDAMNDPRSYMIGRKIIEGGRTLSKEQAADPETDLKALAMG